MHDLYLKIIAIGGAILAFIVGLVSFKAKYKADGRREVKIEATEEALKRSVEANEIDDDVEKIPDDKLDDALAEWMRDDTDKRV